AYDKQKNVPHLAGALNSNFLDFNDLAPLVGMQDKPRGPKAEAAGTAPAKKVKDPNRRVLPTSTLDLARLKAMNSDVHFVASKVTNVKHLPLDRFDMRVRLQDGVLNLDPMKLGLAGGTLAGALRIDSHANPAVTEANLHARGL